MTLAEIEHELEGSHFPYRLNALLLIDKTLVEEHSVMETNDNPSSSITFKDSWELSNIS